MFKSFLPIFFMSMTIAFLEAPQKEDIIVNVKINGFKSEDGVCRLLLFVDKKGFPYSSRNAALMISGRIREKSSGFSFKVKPGTYAI